MNNNPWNLDFLKPDIAVPDISGRWNDYIAEDAEEPPYDIMESDSESDASKLTVRQGDFAYSIIAESEDGKLSLDFEDDGNFP